MSWKNVVIIGAGVPGAAGCRRETGVQATAAPESVKEVSSEPRAALAADAGGDGHTVLLMVANDRTSPT
jgi:hypothetical protein